MNNINNNYWPMKPTTYKEINNYKGYSGEWTERTLDKDLEGHLNIEGNAVNLETEDLKVCGIWKEHGRYWMQWLPITEENDANSLTAEISNFLNLEEVFSMPQLFGETW